MRRQGGGQQGRQLGHLRPVPRSGGEGKVRKEAAGAGLGGNVCVGTRGRGRGVAEGERATSLARGPTCFLGNGRKKVKGRQESGGLAGRSQVRGPSGCVTVGTGWWSPEVLGGVAWLRPTD